MGQLGRDRVRSLGAGSCEGRWNASRSDAALPIQQAGDRLGFFGFDLLRFRLYLGGSLLEHRSVRIVNSLPGQSPALSCAVTETLRLF